VTVLGVDACRGGWVAIGLSDDRSATGLFAATLDELLSLVGNVEGIAIDIPLGIPEHGRRAADVEAKRFVGARRNSVFFTPVRAALQAPTHAQATVEAKRLTGYGVSQQAYALAGKILEAERWRPQAASPVWEVHPEVSFAVLLGRPARAPKRTWAGLQQRLDSLERAGIDLGGVGEVGQRVAADDVLDAAVAAWSARRLVDGEGISVPDPPEAHAGTGEPVAIWA